jgi:hypothetical protein
MLIGIRTVAEFQDLQPSIILFIIKLFLKNKNKSPSKASHWWSTKLYLLVSLNWKERKKKTKNQKRNRNSRKLILVVREKGSRAN